MGFFAIAVFVAVSHQEESHALLTFARFVGWGGDLMLSHLGVDHIFVFLR